MFFLVLRAYLLLISFDLCMTCGDFQAVYRKVRLCPTKSAPTAEGTAQQICSAVDMACIWYWKEVLCLQRSAVTACLLKRHGVPARMMIGARRMPFGAHAWVEAFGRVVNDKPYVREMYAVLDQC
jgi:hypothetical protein